MDDDRIKAAYRAMDTNDPDAATLADAMVQWIARDLGIEGFSLSRVQRFAWYDLWVNWDATVQQKRRMLTAGAALFDALELGRYASVLRSSTTQVIMAAHARSYADGLDAYQKAFVASGIDPPDLVDLEWGDNGGAEENAARMAIARSLERAMDDGRLTPGSSGWKAKARAIAAEVVDFDHPEIPGQSWRSAILTERIEYSLLTLEQRSPELHTMMSGTVNRLLSPIPPPADLEHHLAPAGWFLDSVSDGLKMTAAGYLPTAMVRGAADRFGWDKGWSTDPPKMELDSSELMTLHELLLDARLVRHNKGLIKRTATGSRLVDDPEHLWRMLTAALTQDDWYKSVAQVYTLLLLSGEDDADTLCNRTRKIVTQFGYRSGDEPPGEYDVKRTWWAVSLPLEVLGGLSKTGHYRPKKYVLTPFGEATLLERLRLDMTGPAKHT